MVLDDGLAPAVEEADTVLPTLNNNKKPTICLLDVHDHPNNHPPLNPDRTITSNVVTLHTPLSKALILWNASIDPNLSLDNLFQNGLLRHGPDEGNTSFPPPPPVIEN